MTFFRAMASAMTRKRGINVDMIASKNRTWIALMLSMQIDERDGECVHCMQDVTTRCTAARTVRQIDRHRAEWTARRLPDRHA
jgi:hypothetical protein